MYADEKPIVGMNRLIREIFIVYESFKNDSNLLVQDINFQFHKSGPKCDDLADTLVCMYFSRDIDRQLFEKSNAEEYKLSNSGKNHISQEFELFPINVKNKLLETRKKFDQLKEDEFLNYLSKNHGEYFKSSKNDKKRNFSLDKNILNKKSKNKCKSKNSVAKPLLR
ncbi:hypothetical protein [Methanolapillus ohkumae]|uniref:hypothetical protein n=1 Tax=Methanolapillus ohkumae TaxID=3028298 RepID=UPI0030B8F00E